MKAIIGKKVGMSQIFDENGKVIPVTVIEAGPCTVVQKKTAEKEGYAAVQLGFEDVPERKLTKPEMGHLNKAGVAPKKYLREFEPRRRPRPSSCRFHGLYHRSQPYLQGQDRRRPDGLRPGDHPEPGHREGRS